MAKRKIASASDEEDHSEGGSEDLEDLDKPEKQTQKQKQKQKPQKGKAVKKEAQDEPGSDGSTLSKGSPVAKTAKKPKFAKEEDEDAAIRQSDEGLKYIDLGRRKRAAVRSFKGSIFVDIREYYESGGTEKPGKKGISLSLEQWKCLKRGQGAIDTLFAESAK